LYLSNKQTKEKRKRWKGKKWGRGGARGGGGGGRGKYVQHFGVKPLAQQVI